MTPAAPTPPPAPSASTGRPALAVPSLARIVTIARAGGLSHARALFEAGGYAAAVEDPAALAVAGRLAKDAALREPAAARAPLYARAAACYGAAFALAPQPYTRINQATLTWLAGDRAAGQALARALLDQLDRADHPPETPYWLAATRAEAHLLLGERSAAADWLGAAVALNPAGLEDRAATLRQLRLIATDGGADAGWLDAFRPGSVVHFGGHLGIAEAQAPDLAERIAGVLDAHRAVAGHGALAAGADLVIAEALLARGAELHVILPVPPEAFLAQSVEPFGAGWAGRFAAACAAATSLRWVSSLAGGYEPLATRLAADVAMGAARVQAGRIEADPLQVLVTDGAAAPYGAGRGTAYLGDTWRSGAGGEARQVCLPAPRGAPVAASGTRPPEGRTDLRLVSLLHLSFAGLTDLDDAGWSGETDALLAAFHRRAGALRPVPDWAMATAQGYVLGFFAPDQAWAFAREALALSDGEAGAGGRLRLAAHHGLAHWLPASGGLPDRLAGRLLAELDDLAAAALPGVALASETFVAALGLRDPAPPAVEAVGEAAGQSLFALRSRNPA